MTYTWSRPSSVNNYVFCSITVRNNDLPIPKSRVLTQLSVTVVHSTRLTAIFFLSKWAEVSNFELRKMKPCEMCEKICWNWSDAHAKLICLYSIHFKVFVRRYVIHKVLQTFGLFFLQNWQMFYCVIVYNIFFLGKL